MITKWETRKFIIYEQYHKYLQTLKDKTKGRNEILNDYLYKNFDMCMFKISESEQLKNIQ